jgi:carbamoylphosphate synthase small subunit
MQISLGKCLKSDVVPNIFTVDTKEMWKRRQQRIMMQQICTEDKNAPNKICCIVSIFYHLVTH